MWPVLSALLPVRKFWPSDDDVAGRFPFGIAVCQCFTVRPYQRREAHQFFHHIGYSVVVRRGLHAARRVELLERFGDTRLVRNGEHSHPAAEQTQGVHGVEALRAAGYLHHGQGAALGRPDAGHFKRQMVNLRLHDTGNLTVAFRAAPDLSL